MGKKAKAAVAVASTLIGAARYEALLSPEQIVATANVVTLVSADKTRKFETRSACRDAVALVFPIGHEPDKATFVEWLQGVAEQIAENVCGSLPVFGDDLELLDDKAQAKRYAGVILNAKQDLRAAYQRPDMPDGTIGTRDLPDAGRKVEGAVPPGMNAKKVAKGFTSKATGAVEYSAKLADYPFDGAMLVRVAKWAEATAELCTALTADAAASMGEKKAA